MKNIIISGVGGQGLVLMTKLISKAALEEGYDVKTNDVVGLSQRGGMVWGSVKFGNKVYSPNILEGEADFMVSLEPLEALRWKHMMKKEGTILVNIKEIYSTHIQQETEEYPFEQIEKMYNQYNVIKIEATKIAKDAGNIQVSNVLMLGALSKYLDIKNETWDKVINEVIKEQFIKLNMEIFKLGQSI